MVENLVEQAGGMIRSALGVDTAPEGAPPLVRRNANWQSVHDRRQVLIDAAKRYYERNTKRLLANNQCETFDVCTLAFFHDILTGDGDSKTIEPDSGLLSAGPFLPLHMAIAKKHEVDGTSTASEKEVRAATLQPATTAQVAEVVSWITHNYFSFALEMLHKRHREAATDGDKKKYEKVRPAA